MVPFGEAYSAVCTARVEQSFEPGLDSSAACVGMSDVGQLSKRCRIPLRVRPTTHKAPDSRQADVLTGALNGQAPTSGRFR